MRDHQTRLRSLAAFLALVSAALALLWGGALLAVSFQGALRFAFGVAAVAGYLYFFAHALRRIGLTAQP